jgi:hypothetical protein
MDDRIPCGSHEDGEFDYTCDDCALPHDEPDYENESLDKL